MHVVIAYASLLLATLLWVWSLRRSLRDVERRLADAENRLSLAEWTQRDESAIQDGYRRGYLARLRQLDRRDPCRRRHAEDFSPLVYRPAPIPQAPWHDDEEAFNPLMR